MAADGSPEYVLTWKHWDMESGPPICALRARGRRTSDSDCSGWPTPKAHRPDQDSQYARGNPTLGRVASMAGWVSPTARDHSRGVKPPRSHDKGIPLSQQVHGLTSTSSSAPTANNGVLEPAFPRWLIGYPESWDRNSPGYEDWSKVQDAIASGG